jgi:hypothetical protein
MLSGAGTLTLQTWGFGGGTNAAGMVIPAGGFDPFVGVFNSSGDLIQGTSDVLSSLLRLFGSNYLWLVLVRQDAYTLEVQRGGEQRSFALQLKTRHDSKSLDRILSSLTASLGFCLAGLLLGLAKPEDRLTRLASLTLLAWAAYQLGQSLLSMFLFFPFLGRLVYTSVFLSFPLEFALAYHFYYRFPQSAPRGPLLDRASIPVLSLRQPALFRRQVVTAGHYWGSAFRPRLPAQPRLAGDSEHSSRRLRTDVGAGHGRRHRAQFSTGEGAGSAPADSVDHLWLHCGNHAWGPALDNSATFQSRSSWRVPECSRTV